MRTHVSVWGGELSIGTINRPLTRDGQPTSLNYDGEAVLEGDKLVIAFSDYHIVEYEIGDATPASIAYTLGYDHARHQKRQTRHPSLTNPKFAKVAEEDQPQVYRGWSAAWEQKREYGRTLF